MVTYTSKCDSITNHSFIPLLWLLPIKDAVQFQYSEAVEPNSALFLFNAQVGFTVTKWRWKSIPPGP